MAYRLQPVAFADLPGWDDDDPSPLGQALLACREHILTAKPYRTGSLGISVSDLLPAFDAAVTASFESSSASRNFFENQFQPFHILPSDGRKGFVTAFYEPDVEVSDRPDGDYRYPFYRRPVDLVDVDESNRPEGMDSYFVFGRHHEGMVEEYPDRGAIERGFLADRHLEIAYAKSRVDVFFAHVQGAARLLYPDGSVKRITYAAKTGHRFSPVGKLLIDRGEIDRTTVSMMSIRKWLAEHPDQLDDVLWRNRSFIFFREAPVASMDLGPIAAAKVPLVAGRSLAVDRLIHTFGVPFYIRSPSLIHMDGDRGFQRLMLALDTGSAIVGPARGDIFTGSGEAAGLLAGAVRNAADFYILIPKAAAARYVDG